METNQKQTRLQEIQIRLAGKMARAIVEAIENGAEIERSQFGVTVDGVFIVGGKYNEDNHCIVFKLNSPEIDELFKPKKEQLEERVETLRAELREIENKLNSK